MQSLNRVMLIGYLARDPSLTVSKSGHTYTRLSVTTHRQWLNKEDKQVTRTDWHSVFVWGALAQKCCHDLQKGALILVEGALTYWQVATQEGHRNAIHGMDVKFLSPPKAASPQLTPVTEMVCSEQLDNPEPSLNHNAVVHPA